jgi:hypothetical protein
MSNGFIILVTIGKKGRFWCLSGIGGLSGRESRWASVVAAALYERIGPSEYRRPLKQSEKRPGGGLAALLLGMWRDECGDGVDAGVGVRVGPPAPDRFVDLRHPDPCGRRCTVPVRLELLLELMDGLIRDTEPAAGLGCGDRIVSVESGACQERVESFVVLAGDELDVPYDCSSQGESALSSDRCSQRSDVTVQKPPIKSGPCRGDGVRGGIDSWEVLGESGVVSPHGAGPRFCGSAPEGLVDAGAQRLVLVVIPDPWVGCCPEVRNRACPCVPPSIYLGNREAIEPHGIVTQASTPQDGLGSRGERHRLRFQIVTPVFLENRSVVRVDNPTQSSSPVQRATRSRVCCVSADQPLGVLGNADNVGDESFVDHDSDPDHRPERRNCIDPHSATSELAAEVEHVQDESRQRGSGKDDRDLGSEAPSPRQNRTAYNDGSIV